MKKIKLTPAGEDLLVSIIGHTVVISIALLIIGLVGAVEGGLIW